MSYARVFACVGDQVPVETRNAALRRMLQAVTRSAEPITDGFGILSVANATAVLASQPADTVDHTLVQAITRRSVDTVIEQLGKQPGFIAIRMARSLVPLIAMLPNSEQKEALGQLLSFVATKTEPDEDLLLVLAQAVEVLAEKSVFSKGNQLEQWLNEQEVWLALAKPDGVAHLAVARLIVPLAEAVEMPTDVVEKLLQIAGIEGSATDLIAITNAIRQAPLKDEGSPTSIANRMRLGLQGRLLATLVTQGHVDPSASGSAAEVIREAFKPVSMQPTGSFAREGLARALAALAPQLGDRVRESALETARMYLARTGSAGEAAAWSRTIAKLLESEKDDLKFVEQIVEVLKYPNTALRPREPGVEEPRSATDILVKALRSRLALHLPDGKRPWGGDLQQVLDEIKKDERFRRISLTEPPECPKLSGVCLEPNS